MAERAGRAERRNAARGENEDDDEDDDPDEEEQGTMILKRRKARRTTMMTGLRATVTARLLAPLVHAIASLCQSLKTKLLILAVLSNCWTCFALTMTSTA